MKYTKKDLRNDIIAYALSVITLAAVVFFAGYPLWQIAVGKI